MSTPKTVQRILAGPHQLSTEKALLTYVGQQRWLWWRWQGRATFPAYLATKLECSVKDAKAVIQWVDDNLVTGG